MLLNIKVLGTIGLWICQENVNAYVCVHISVPVLGK